MKINAFYFNVNFKSFEMFVRNIFRPQFCFLNNTNLKRLSKQNFVKFIYISVHKNKYFKKFEIKNNDFTRKKVTWKSSIVPSTLLVSLCIY